MSERGLLSGNDVGLLHFRAAERGWMFTTNSLSPAALDADFPRDLDLY